MIRFALAFSAFLLCFQVFAQNKVTISGYVRDASTGEELLGSTVFIKEIGSGVVTNGYGFYSLTLAPGEYTILFSFIGYETVVKKLDLSADVSLNISLSEETQTLEEVIVVAQREDENVTTTQMSRNDIDIAQVKKLPSLFGEPDIIKTIQLMPGVISAGEGTSAFFVRGGSADQNLILIDEAPVYDPSHLFGLFSVFNADVIKSSELYKGGTPARYGGRLSSVLDVRTKDGNNQRFAGEAGIGLLASSLMLEGPIKKNESSFIISARRSYVDLFLEAANQDNLVYFYDVNAKINWKASNKDRIFLSLYTGRDDFDFSDTFGFDWGNRTATLRWNHLFNDRIFSNTTFIANSFDYGLASTSQTNTFNWDSNLRELSFKEDLNFYVSPALTLDFGYHLTYRQFSPGTIVPGETSFLASTELQKEQALDHAIYLSVKHQISDKLTLDYGGRLSYFQQVGDYTLYLYDDVRDNINPLRIDSVQYDNLETIVDYLNFEPRFSARYLVNNHTSLKFSYQRMVQNTHLISSGTVPIPFNTWAPSSRYLKPQKADQFAVGYFRNFKQNAYALSVEAYYKDMQNVTDFADNASIFFNQDLATEFRQGVSTAYGVEFLLQKKKGALTGFISYTWSKAERTVEGVNQGNVFFANYDRRNNLNVVATYEHSPKWTFGGNFTYGTGRPITLTSGTYEFGESYLPDIITERNGYRLPAFHRIDLSATLIPQKVRKNKQIETSWVFGLYNIYSRKNPFTLFTSVPLNDEGQVEGDGTLREARMIYLFPILPSITYNIRF